MKQSLKSILESLIFVYGKPVEKKRLAKVCNVEIYEIDKVLEELNNEYRQTGRGIRLMLKSSEVQMATAPEYAGFVEKMLTLELNEDLSKVSLETLAIVAYRGPIIKADVEAIRGVNCDYILRNLAMKGLIEKKQSSEDARLMIYEASMKFLRHMGVERVEELPDYKEMRHRLNTDL